MSVVWDTLGVILLFIVVVWLFGLGSEKEYPIAYVYFANVSRVNATTACSAFNLTAVNSTLTPSSDIRIYAYCYNQSKQIIRVAITPK